MMKHILVLHMVILGGTLLCTTMAFAGYKVYPCSTTEAVETTWTQCNRCKNRFYYDGTCFLGCTNNKVYGTKMGSTENVNGCYTCDDGDKILTLETECKKCGNEREWTKDTMWDSKGRKGWCILKECTTNTFQDEDSNCIPCDSPKSVYLTSDHKDRCATCQNRFYDETLQLCILNPNVCADSGGYLTTDGYCTPCTSTDGSGILSGYDSLCNNCPGRYALDSSCKAPCPDGSFYDSYGQCISCANPNAISISTPENCVSCPTRKVENDLCVLKSCGDDEFLRLDGSCVPCDTLAPQTTDTSLCTCANREMVNGQCVLKTCPDGKFRDKRGTCFDCTVTDTIADTDETECAKCTNREPYGSYCIPRCATGTYRYSVDECRSCDTVQDGTVTFFIRACTDCGFTPTQITSSSAYTCHKTCPDGQFNGGDGQCYACDTANAVPTSSEACAVCGDVREHQSGKCLLKTCPDGMFKGRKAGTSYDTCYTCDDSSGDITSSECTQKCGNTRILGTNNICYSCQELNPFDVADQTACEQCPNRTYTMMGKCALSQCPDNTFSDYNGSCYACDDTNNQIRSSDCVEKCGDQRVLVGEYCAKACKTGEIRNGISCLSCDAQQSTIETTQAECEKCGTLREMVDGKCLFKCPDGQFRDQYGQCQQCTDEYAYGTTATQCSRCNGARTMKDDTCILTTCPDEYYRDDSSYSCAPCEVIIGATKDYQWVNAERACAECGLFWVNDTCTKVVCTDTQFVGTDGQCHECSDQVPWSAKSSQCAKCGSKRISVDMGYGYFSCILCDGTLENTSMMGLEEATCTKCCRGTATYTDDGVCICGTVEEELNCPSGSFAGLDDQWAYSSQAFQCFSCDISYDISLTEADLQYGIPTNHGEQECLACGNRIVVGSVCRLATCGTDEFWDATTTTCHKCTDTTSYPGVSQKACESCSNRTYVSGYGKSFCVFSGD